MIEYIRGILDELTPTQATIEAHGVGYLLNISLNSYTALQGKSEARLFVYESIREDTWTLFGFATKQERELFLLLISVSGVGGNTARTMLSSFSAPELATLIMDGNERMLKTVKGLGAKTAQRIIVELRDKVASLGMEAMPKCEQAGKVGEAVAKKALEAGIQEVVFDRNGYLYHGRVKEVAEGARKGGLKF